MFPFFCFCFKWMLIVNKSILHDFVNLLLYFVATNSMFIVNIGVRVKIRAK